MEIQFFKRNKSVHRRVVKNERRADFHSSLPFLRGINTWTACMESFNILNVDTLSGDALAIIRYYNNHLQYVSRLPIATSP